MPTSAISSREYTTINYTLSWSHLENPSNTTFSGPTQIDICRCGPSPGQNLPDLGHIYTRYRCQRPRISFAAPEDELWVLQAPLGQVNLLRPANFGEIERRESVTKDAEPTAYAGQNLVLLTGPCPRGRYQAYATVQFLRSLTPEARSNVEYLSLLIQPYEEDCVDDQGGRAYVDLAKYIVQNLPAFKALFLNIWGEETRLWAREFALVLEKEGAKVVVSWDWSSDEVEEYDEIGAFLRGVEDGVVKKRLVWPSEAGGDETEGSSALDKHLADHNRSGSYTATKEGTTSGELHEDGLEDDATTTACRSSSDGEWFDAICTPLPPHDASESENGS
jgi:hypothetical protein